MNTRTSVLIAAILLIGAGLGMTLWQLLTTSAPIEPTVKVAVAAQRIEPYTIITQEMIKFGEDMRASRAYDRGAYSADHVVGKMSTDAIAPGSLITGVNVKPIREIRFAEDLGLVNRELCGRRRALGRRQYPPRSPRKPLRLWPR